MHFQNAVYNIQNERDRAYRGKRQRHVPVVPSQLTNAHSESRVCVKPRVHHRRNPHNKKSHRKRQKRKRQNAENDSATVSVTPEKTLDDKVARLANTNSSSTKHKMTATENSVAEIIL